MKKLTTLFLIPMSVALLSGCGHADKVVPARNEGENVLSAELLDANISGDYNKKSEKISSEMINVDLGKEVSTVALKGDYFLEVKYNDNSNAVYSLIAKKFVIEKGDYNKIEYKHNHIVNATQTDTEERIILNKYIDLLGNVLLDDPNFVVTSCNKSNYLDGKEYVFFEYLDTANGAMHSKLIKYIEDFKLLVQNDVNPDGSKYFHTIGGSMIGDNVQIIDLDEFGCKGYKMRIEDSSYTRVYIYNSNYEVVKTYTLPVSLLNLSFIADGKMFYQQMYSGTSKDYDVLDATGYYKLNSGYVDILTGECTKVDCNYVIDSVNTTLYDLDGRVKYSICNIKFINENGSFDKITQRFIIDSFGTLHNNVCNTNISSLIKIGNRYWDPIEDIVYNAQLETLMVDSGIMPIYNSDYIVYRDFCGLYGIADKYFNVMLEPEFDSVSYLGLKNGGLMVSKASDTLNLHAIKVHNGSYETIKTYEGFVSQDNFTQFYAKLSYEDSTYKIVSLLTGEEAPTQYIDYSNTTRYTKLPNIQSFADYENVGFEELAVYKDTVETNTIVNFYANVYAD